MLPYSLKVVWFCLSLTGIVACWTVLFMFSRAIGSYWGPILYCVFATLLQGIFCLGLIYDMNPFQMPKAFCVVQTFVIYYSAWSLTGVCAAFTFATSSSVLWPSWRRPTTSTLAWKNKYYIPIFVFPLACLCISVPVLLRVNAIQPTNDLHCDASHPEWGRFLGYAGFSMILTIPCLFLSAVTARRVHQLHRDIQRSIKYSIGHLSNGQNGPSEGMKSPVVPSNDKRPAPMDPEIQYSSRPMSVTVDTPSYDVAARSPTATFGPHAASPKQSDPCEVSDDERPPRRVGSMMMSSMTNVASPPKPNLVPAIWRLILFQMAFFTIQCLAALSTVIDVARHQATPTPFGSQHIALILVGWGPALLFGHLPAVRRQLMFWK